MLHQSLKTLAALAAAVILTGAAEAAPGQRYDVKKNGTKVHSAPRDSAPVVNRLNSGDRVIEWRRRDGWVNVSPLGKVGKEGWIRSGNLRAEASEIEIEISPNGHFFVQAQVNGVALEFMVDTGATNVTLSPADARALGFDDDKLNFTHRSRTAGGIVPTAPVVLKEMRIGLLSLPNVAARVNGEPMGISLLGMSFLRRLRSYEVINNKLVLRY